GQPIPDDLRERYREMRERAARLAHPGRFFLRTAHGDATLTAAGTVEAGQRWHGSRFTVHEGGTVLGFNDVEKVPGPYRAHFEELLANRGLTHVGLVGYTREHGRLPPLDWAMVAAFTAIAGLGSLANTLFSNYCRDKGWGMGAHVGAIPSAVGGRNIAL